MLKGAIAGIALISSASACDAAGADPRIARTETGLKPAIIFKGRPAPHHSIEQQLQHFKVPGVSVAVVEDCKIAWARGYGKRNDREFVTPQTLFLAGSVSKPVAAVAALRMVERGQLQLDTNVNDTLRSWKLPENAFTRKRPVTLRLLLSHGAGTTVPGFGGYPRGTAIPTIRQILDGQPPANSDPVRVDKLPGENWRYSGGGYTIAQLLMSDAARTPFPKLMYDLVLNPLGMSSSTYDQKLPRTWAARAAHGRRSDGSPVPGGWHVYPEMAAAGLWTTPADLSRFLIGVIHAWRGDAGGILHNSTAMLMLTRQMGSWGLGPQLDGEGKAFRFSHAGVDEGFLTQVVAFPDTCQGAAIMAHSDWADPLMQELLRSIAEQYRWPAYSRSQRRAMTPLTHAQQNRLTGTFEFVEPSGLAVNIVNKHGFLEVTWFEQTFSLVGESTDVLLAPDSGMVFAFEDDANTLKISTGDGQKYVGHRKTAQ